MKGGLFYVLVWACLIVVSHAGDRILSYHSDIEVNQDTSLSVVETIVVDVRGGDIEHGIFRDFPRIYKGDYGLKRKRGFEVINVRLNNESVRYTVEKLNSGSRVRIGSAHVWLSPGVYTYLISYRTTRQLGYFDDYDELYWNVTGNGWKFPINKVSATVTLPDANSKGVTEIKKFAWTGPVGSKEEAVKITKLDDGRVRFESTRSLKAREGMTLAISWPKGHVDYSQDRDSFLTTLRENPEVMILGGCFVLMIIYLVVAWFRVGIDPRSGTIIPRYEPPEGYSPAAVRNLDRMEFDDGAFTAAVLGLAAKGALKIKDKGGKMRLVKKSNHEALESEEEEFYDNLFSSDAILTLHKYNAISIKFARNRLDRNLDDKLNSSHYIINGTHWMVGMLFIMFSSLLSAVIFPGAGLMVLILHFVVAGFTMGYLKKFGTNLRVRNRRWWRGLVAVIALAAWWGTIVMVARDGSWAFASILIVAELILLVFDHLIKAYTKFGRSVMDQVEGFRMYLSIAEKDRLNLENPPERTPELFEKFLPYALALDVEHQWAQQFSEVLNSIEDPQQGDAGEVDYRPSYYQGGNQHFGHGVAAAVAVVSGTLGANLASASVSPSSSSGTGGSSSSGGGGYSGGFSGGGGYSGGGGGGGGGGGW